MFIFPHSSTPCQDHLYKSWQLYAERYSFMFSRYPSPHLPFPPCPHPTTRSSESGSLEVFRDFQTQNIPKGYAIESRSKVNPIFRVEKYQNHREKETERATYILSGVSTFPKNEHFKRNKHFKTDG